MNTQIRRSYEGKTRNVWLRLILRLPLHPLIPEDEQVAMSLSILYNFIHSSYVTIIPCDQLVIRLIRLRLISVINSIPRFAIPTSAN